MRTIAVLGATGSIGTQALDLVLKYQDRFSVAALTAHSQSEKLYELVRKFRPKVAGLVVEPGEMPCDVKEMCEWFFGATCSEDAIYAAKPDDALVAVVGIAGLQAVMAALTVCERLLLANKESLVAGGALVMEKARTLGRTILPVDSEHSAIFQCLRGAGANGPAKLILTASGGPFRATNVRDMENASVEAALGHPTWRMGGKISIDSATMMNKGLEVMEAHHLFSMPPDAIEVVIHKESVIHSMVEFKDGAVLAQMGRPDMRGAIGYAMGYPDRLPFGGERLSFAQAFGLSFEPWDPARFPCVRMAYDALKAGPSHCVTLNGANERAVAAFLSGRIPFGAIARVAARSMERHAGMTVRSIDDVLEVDRMTREMADEFIQGGLK